MTELAPTDRTRLRRVHERGRYDRGTIDAILDSGMMCHVGYVIDGLPYVTPTLYWREDNRVYWHGSSASRMLRQSEGAEVCLTVTHLDGLVLARSAFHHSANHRSVMLFGRAEKVTDRNDKVARLKTFVDLTYPGRWEQLREMTEQESKATTILSILIDEASAKVRAGPPVDDEEDYVVPVWAGVVPVRTHYEPPVPCPRLVDGTPLPDHVAGHGRDQAVGNGPVRRPTC